MLIINVEHALQANLAFESGMIGFILMDLLQLELVLSDI